MKIRIPFRPQRPRVAVIRLQGAIGTAGRGLSDQSTAPLIEKAFRSGPDAVALAINSPGGSPVQSSLIEARIRRLADEHDIPVYAFVEDVAASGGYWLASAADHIYVDRSSIVGSIGVISAGFGMQDLIAQYGIERRVYTAGTSKSQLDPFKPENPEDVARLKQMLEQVHQTFKDQVQGRRGDRLADEDLFNGNIWVGQNGIDVGLADEIGHLVPTMKSKLGEKTRFKVFAPSRRSVLSRIGGSILGDAMYQIEERSAFARFGL